MTFHTIAAGLATLLLAALAVFQLLLAAGMPLGHLSWGGTQPRVLPPKMRALSAVAVGVIALAAWVVLARADIVMPGADAAWVRVAAWVFSAYFGLNTLGNLASKSPSERAVMTPLSTVLTACFVIVALS